MWSLSYLTDKKTKFVKSFPKIKHIISNQKTISKE